MLLRQLEPWIRMRFTSEAIGRALESLPELDASRPDFGALASTWYDERTYGTLLDLLLSTRPELDRNALAREAAESILRTPARGTTSGIFTLMATPALYARYAQRTWDTSHDTGTVSIEHVSPCVARHRVRGWQGHHDFACELNRQSSAVIYERMGLVGVEILSHSCTPSVCQTTYKWNP